tara:strand:- start:4 stop:294 length:291 start_codon:yes stop_codon:yes gene_type:complete
MNIELVKKHFGVEISGNWDEKCDFYIYEETTYDGYEVYVVTTNPDKINIQENVHYYNTEIIEQIVDAISSRKYKKIFLMIDTMDIETAFEMLEEMI